MSEKNNNLNDTLSAITGLLVWIIPILQLFFDRLPDSIKDIFLNQDIFIYTSFLTLLISIFVILAYKSNPYFRIVLNRWHIKEYIKYLKATDPKFNKPQDIIKINAVNPPLEITANYLVWIFLFVGIISGYWFVNMGLKYFGQQDIPYNITFFQTILYSLTFICSVFVLTHFTFKLSQTKNWNDTKKERIQKAIDLALKHNSFPELQNKIKFEYCHEERQGLHTAYVVGVDVQGKKYEINTDIEAETLNNVRFVK